MATQPLQPGVSPANSALAPTPTPFRVAEARYRSAMAQLEGQPHDLEKRDPAAFEYYKRAFFDSVEAVDAAPISSWSEFAEAFEIACDGGHSVPGEDLIFKLLADVRRLSGRAA
jgi:hypothetical protein